MNAIVFCEILSDILFPHMNRIIAYILVGIIVVGGGVWYVTRDAGSLSQDTDETLQDLDFFSGNGPEAETGTQRPAPEPSIAVGEPAPGTSTNQNNIMNATLHTTMGDITIEFFSADAPNTVKNFVTLAQAGFYDKTKFHRVIENFMIQGGDPLSKDDAMMARWGTGGPGYAFEDEIHANNKNNAGTIAMANSGPNTNGSQFFINARDNNYLDPKHTVFGRVIAGMDVVQKIETTPTGEADRPISPVIIERITLSEK